MKNDDDIIIEETEPIEDLMYERQRREILKNLFSNNNKEYEERAISQSWDETEERFKIDKETIDTFLDNVKVDTFLKKVYAITLLIVLVLQLVSINVVFILTGRGILKYSDTAFNIFISGALIEVIALVMIVVKYLFHDNIGETLKNILEKNKKK